MISFAALTTILGILEKDGFTNEQTIKQGAVLRIFSSLCQDTFDTNAVSDYELAAKLHSAPN